MGTPIASPSNIVLDPYFAIARGAPGNPWGYPAGWDNIDHAAEWDQGGIIQRPGLIQALAGKPGGSEYTMEFDILSIKTSSVGGDGMRVTWAGYNPPRLYEAAHVVYHFTTAGAGTHLIFFPPTDVGNTGKMRLDNVLIYEQNLTDFVCVHLLNLPPEYTMTETWDLGGGRWMFLFANTITGINTLLIYEV